MQLYFLFPFFSFFVQFCFIRSNFPHVSNYPPWPFDLSLTLLLITSLNTAVAAAFHKTFILLRT